MTDANGFDLRGAVLAAPESLDLFTAPQRGMEHGWQPNSGEVQQPCRRAGRRVPARRTFEFGVPVDGDRAGRALDCQRVSISAASEAFGEHNNVHEFLLYRSAFRLTAVIQPDCE